MACRPQTAPTKVFLDASVLIAAAISPRGAARDLLIAGSRGQISLSLGQLTITETERNLRRKAPAALPVFIFLIQALPIELITPPRALVEHVASQVAVKDAPIVAGAVHARAAYLASYDRKHLLSQATAIEAAFNLVVASPDAILTSIGGEAR